jgi:hypothetical protein
MEKKEKKRGDELGQMSEQIQLFPVVDGVTVQIEKAKFSKTLRG